MKRNKQLRKKYFLIHRIDNKYKNLGYEVHHVVEWSEVKNGVIPKQDIEQIDNLLLLKKIAIKRLLRKPINVDDLTLDRII